MTATSNETPLRECTPWCFQGIARHAEEFPEDRSCWSPFTHLPLSLSRGEMSSDGWRADQLILALRRWPDSSETRVILNDNDSDHDIALTIAEARLLAAHLLEYADLAETTEAAS